MVPKCRMGEEIEREGTPRRDILTTQKNLCQMLDGGERERGGIPGMGMHT